MFFITNPDNDMSRAALAAPQGWDVAAIVADDCLFACNGDTLMLCEGPSVMELRELERKALIHDGSGWRLV